MMLSPSFCDYKSLKRTCRWMLFYIPLVGTLWACAKETEKTSPDKQEITARLDSLMKEGIEARENNQFKKAIQLHQEELKVAKLADDSISIVAALNHIATNYRRLGLLDEAARYHYEALMLTIKQEDQANPLVRKNRVRSLNGLGNIYLTVGDLHQADSVLRMALAGEKALDSKLGQAINLANLGNIKEQIGETDSAWIYYRYSLAMNRQAKSKLGEALCFSHFARLHEQQGNIKEAIAELEHSISIMADSPDDWHKLDATLNLARLHAKQGKRQEAKTLLAQAKETAERIHSLAHRSQVYQQYYELYEQEGNATAALDNYRRSVELKDSLLSSKQSADIQNMRIELERQRQQGKLDQANERYYDEHQAHVITTTVLLCSTVVGICIILALSYTIHERNKTQRIIKEVNNKRKDFFANIALDPAEMKTDVILSEQDRQFIGRFVDVVYSQMNKGKTDVESVAERMQLNRAQLNRRILAITGQNTLSYITQIRISKAKRLLRADLTSPVGDIANKCGFDDLAYFSRLFKQQTGMTPSQYRKMV